MKVGWSYLDVMGGRVVLRVVVRVVGLAGLPVDSKLALLDSVTYPEEAHVHCFGSLGLDCVVGNAFGRRVVGLHGSRSVLWPSHLGESVAKHCYVLAIDEERASF